MLKAPTQALVFRGLPAREAPLDSWLAELEHSECDAFYNPRHYTALRGVAVYDGPARVIAYPPRNKRRDSSLVVSTVRGYEGFLKIDRTGVFRDATPGLGRNELRRRAQWLRWKDLIKYRAKIAGTQVLCSKLVHHWKEGTDEVHLLQ
jgi:hypothetical protein